MAGSRRIVVEFLGKDVSAGSEASAVEKRFGKLGGKLDKVGQIAGKALAGGLLLAGAAAVKMTQAAAEDAEGQAKLATVLRNTTNATDAQVAATEDWITAQGKALGMADDQLRPALAQLVGVTKDVGKAQDDVALAMDVAAGTGKSFESIISALVKAEAGQVSGLSRLGIETTNAEGKTKSLNQITKDLAKTYGGAASAAADTAAGKQKRMQLAFSELQEEIGSKLLPVMERLTAWALDAVNWMEKHQTLVGTLAAVVGTLAAGLYTASLAMRAVNLAMAMNPVGLVVIAIAALAAGLVVAYKKSETFRGIVDSVWEVMKNVGSFIADVFVGYLRILGTAWLTMGIVAIGALKGLLTAAFAVFGGILTAAEKGMGWIPGIGGKIKAAKAAFTDFGDATINKLDAVSGKLKSARDKVNELGNAKGKPEVDASSIDALIVKLDRALARMRSLGANLTANAASGGPWSSGKTGAGKASGGRVWAGTTYPVGERGMELFTPEMNGYITPAHKVGDGGGGSTDVAVAAPLVLQLDSKTVWQGLLKMKRTGGIVELGLA